MNPFPYLPQVIVGACLACGSGIAEALVLDPLAELGTVLVAIEALAALLFLVPVSRSWGMLQEARAASRIAPGGHPFACALPARLRIPRAFSPGNPARTKTAARF